MKVLQVLTDNDRRGAQVFAIELGARLTELGLDVRSVALAPGMVGGLDVEPLGSSRHDPSAIRGLRSTMGTVDVTVGHGSTTLPMGALAGFGPGRPLVYRQISDPIFWTPTRAKRLRTAAAYRAIAHVVALSSITARILEEDLHVDPGRITIIPNAVDERRCPPASDDDRAAARRSLDLPATPARVLAYVGALVEEKGVDDLLTVAAPGEVVLIVGDGPQRGELERRASALGLHTHFTGRLDDPWTAYAAADVFVLPSRGGDSQPAVLIESALVGTPAVATDVGAIPDIVVDGQTGRVVPVGDLAALRAALDSLLDDPERRAAAAAAATTRAQELFSMTSVGLQWATLLEAVAGGRRAPR